MDIMPLYRDIVAHDAPNARSEVTSAAVGSSGQDEHAGYHVDNKGAEKHEP